MMAVPCLIALHLCHSRLQKRLQTFKTLRKIAATQPTPVYDELMYPGTVSENRGSGDLAKRADYRMQSNEAYMAPAIRSN